MAKGVYWIGRDGNIYMKSDGLDGVVKWVAPYQTPQQMGLQQIEDPVARPTSTPATTGGGGASSAPAPVLNQAAVNATYGAVDSLATESAVGNQNITDELGRVTGQYDVERNRAEGDYTEQGVTNNQNLQRNRQNALIAAAQGRRGLRGTLAAMGALSGSGGELADRAVTTSANQDLGGATETAAGNTQMLDKAIGRFREDDDVRRGEARNQAENNRTALKGTIASKRQQYYQKLAELFSEGGDTARAGEYLGRVGGLNNEIAQNTRVAAAPITAKAAAFTPGSLESYLAGAGDMTVDVAAGGAGFQNPSSILAGRGRRRKEEELAVA